MRAGSRPTPTATIERCLSTRERRHSHATSSCAAPPLSPLPLPPPSPQARIIGAADVHSLRARAIGRSPMARCTALNQHARAFTSTDDGQRRRRRLSTRAPTRAHAVAIVAGQVDRVGGRHSKARARSLAFYALESPPRCTESPRISRAFSNCFAWRGGRRLVRCICFLVLQ